MTSNLNAAAAEPRSQLDEITTHWSLVSDPVQFVMRYAPAIQKYLRAMIGNADDAEEVSQDFLVQMLQQRFVKARTDRGRFRYYLKQSVRNAARGFFRRRGKAQDVAIDWAELPAEDDALATAEREWTAEWRQCLLDRAWMALESHEHRSPGNRFYTVLQARMTDPTASSATLAERLSQEIGHPLRVEAFDKQVSRARRMFAELVLKEVSETLEHPTAAGVEEELIELELLEYLRDFLPDDWRSQPKLFRRAR